MALPVVIRHGDEGKELTPITDSAKWSTAAIGGFADATFDLPGWRELPWLDQVTILLGDRLVWEGRIEDSSWKLESGERKTTITCFGYRRGLAETSVRRIWSKRDINWVEVTAPPGTAFASVTPTDDVAAALGRFDPADGTKAGVMISANGVDSIAANAGNFAEFVLPSGISVVSWLGSADSIGTDAGTSKWTACWLALESGAWVLKATNTTGGTGQTFSVALASAAAVRVGAINASGAGAVLAADDRWKFYDQRLLGTSLTEDVSGGFYGGTILRDLIALVPGLTAGELETGSDFTIQAIERAVRDSALSVVNEVAGYYRREWGVWEGPRFDWKSVDLDTPDFLIDLNSIVTLELTSSVENVAKTYYVLYPDAASGLDAEASSAASAQRNPFVKQNRGSDVLHQPGFPMTTATGQQLADRIAAERGSYVPASGQIVLSATELVKGLTGPDMPAAAIRAGCNVLLPELPTEDINQGRDGRSLLHVSEAVTDLNTGLVTLSVDSQSRAIDVLLARLAAATRTVTG